MVLTFYLFNTEDLDPVGDPCSSRSLSFSSMKPLSLILILVLTSLKAATLDDLTWTIEDDKVTITDCLTNATGDLVIPETIDDLPVT